MDLGLRMAFGAFYRRTGEARLAGRVGVAGLALHFCVPPVKYIDLIVDEPAQPVYAVMAVQASRPKLHLVCLHEGWVSLCVALNAGLHRGTFL